MAGEFFPNSVCIWFSPLHPNKATDELAGLKLYKPYVVAWYMVVGGLPLGLCLYGLNIARRGQQWFGYSVSAFSGLVYIMVAALVHMGTVSHRIYLDNQGLLFGLLSVLLALFVQFMEQRPYKVAISKGATPAWWWPPMSWAIGVHLALYLFQLLF